MVRVYITFSKPDDIVFLRKAEIVCKRKGYKTLSSYLLYILKDNESAIDSDLDVFLDRCDSDIKKEVIKELANKNIGFNHG